MRSTALKEGSLLRAGRLGRGVRREATGVANATVEVVEVIEVLGDYNIQIKCLFCLIKMKIC